MRVVPISPEFASRLQSKVRRISKELAFNIVTERVRPESLILLGNRDPDDQIITILCQHFDGRKDVTIVKPAMTRVNALRNLNLYLERLRTVTTIVEVLDQEEDSLDRIFEGAEAILRNKNIEYELRRESYRLKEYECTYGSRRLDLILIVSGLDDPNSTKHNIEDRLVAAATELGKVDQNEEFDPKRVWRSLSNDERLNVLREIFSRRSFVKEIFPQHWNGLELIV